MWGFEISYACKQTRDLDNHVRRRRVSQNDRKKGSERVVSPVLSNELWAGAIDVSKVSDLDSIWSQIKIQSDRVTRNVIPQKIQNSRENPWDAPVRTN
jgi:hypothetical protein